MPKTLDRLLTDHRRLRHILAATSQVCDEIRNGNSASSSDHLFCLIDYLSGYPDEVHHPTEDLVFDRLLSLDLTREQADKVRHNRAQHRQLQAATDDLKSQFDSFEEKIDADQFLVALDEYSQLQLKHMRFEEQEIFPLAAEYFSPADWEELDENFSKTTDPLFDHADKRFAALYQHIAHDPEDSAPPVFANALMRYLNATRGGNDES